MDCAWDDVAMDVGFEDAREREIIRAVVAVIDSGGRLPSEVSSGC